VATTCAHGQIREICLMHYRNELREQLAGLKARRDETKSKVLSEAWFGFISRMHCRIGSGWSIGTRLTQKP
jgi:hypothetical protein